MHKLENNWIWGALFTVLLFTISIVIFYPGGFAEGRQLSLHYPEKRIHFDHSMYFSEYKEGFKKPQDVTGACMKCHEDSAEHFLTSSHWTWKRSTNKLGVEKKQIEIGKKNLLNNFCINVGGNWPSCTKCHAGYGWEDASFDFQKKENIDCLVCHDWSGTYTKGLAGIPDASVDLMASAKSVGYPKRENCGMCHFSGGGGMAVKHGDLDDSLIHAVSQVDVHMGKLNMLCIDCHQTKNHQVSGTAYSVSVENKYGIDCTNCHTENIHKNDRINSHTKSIACQTCHIPKYAKRTPTKMTWDWSKAGDKNRKDDPHSYLKIKGEFTYEMNIEPEYFWFNKEVDRYLLGDKMDPKEYTELNKPKGDIKDSRAKIWPFKIHKALQPYDSDQNIFVPVVTAGEGGYWKEFNWKKAIELGTEVNGLSFSGKYGFAKSTMHWPLSHMVSPKSESLGCNDCHSENGRMNWQALGYSGDPIAIGSRKITKE
jgi:octaheme c-type cytochrome (tetrathionate reductase family)